MIRVAIADDHQLVREGFSSILNAQDDIEVVMHAEDGKQLLDAIRTNRTVDVALVDIRMPRLDGLMATQELARIPRAPRVIIVTTFDDDSNVISAIASGAQGFLLKRSSAQELVDAVRSVAAGDAILSPDVIHAVLQRVRASGQPEPVDLGRYELTERERLVLAMIGEGLNNTEISQRLHLSMSTVKSHVSSLLSKTGSRDRVQAALLAVRGGLGR